MKKISLFLIFIGSFYFSQAQLFPKTELEFLSSHWKGERFEDGRPKISDELIKRAKKIGIEEAWQVLHNEGYNNQFEGHWKMVHEDVPVVGRAVTAKYSPTRPDIEALIKERGKKDGRSGNTNAWPIQILQKGDVYVAESFGKIAQGTLIGDNLGASIFNKTGNGVIFDGAARDLSGLAQLKGFNAYVRDFHPSFLEEVVLISLNGPIRIGGAIVMPGDLVLSEREGVLFIPAHLAEKVIATSEFISVRDHFSKDVLKSGKYNAGEIDNQWTEEIKTSFLIWVNAHPNEPIITKEALDKFLEKRTW